MTAWWPSSPWRFADVVLRRCVVDGVAWEYTRTDGWTAV